MNIYKCRRFRQALRRGVLGMPEEPLHQACHVQVTTCSGRGAAKHSRQPGSRSQSSALGASQSLTPQLAPGHEAGCILGQSKGFPLRGRPAAPPPLGSPSFQTRRAGASRWAQGSGACPGSSGGDAGAGRPLGPAFGRCYGNARGLLAPAPPLRRAGGGAGPLARAAAGGAERRGAGGGVSSSRARSAAEQRGG